MIIDEFLVSIGATVTPGTTKVIQKLDEGLRDAAKAATSLTVAIGAVAAGISAMVISTAKGIESTALTAASLGEATDELDRWNKAANLATGRTQGMSAELQSLSKHISQAARGMGTGIKAFGLLSGQGFPGIWDGGNGRLRNTKEVLLDVADALARITDPARRVEMAEMLGLENILPFLLKGRKGVEEYLASVDQLGVATQQEAQVSRELMLSWRQLGLAGQDFRRMMLSSIGPALGDAIKEFVKWYKANREILRTRFVPVLEVLGKMIRALGYGITAVVTAMSKIPTWVWIGALITISSLLSAGILLSLIRIGAALKSIIVVAAGLSGGFLPLIAVAALLAIIGLTLEDIWVSMKGGKGILATWAEEIKPLNWILTVLANQLLLIADGLNLVWTAATNPKNLGEAWKKFASQANQFGESFMLNPSSKDVVTFQEAGREFFGMNLMDKLLGIRTAGIPVSAGGSVTNTTGGPVTNTFNVTMNGVNDPQTFMSKLKNLFSDESTQVINNNTGGPVK